MCNIESILTDAGYGKAASSKPTADRIYDALISLYIRRAALASSTGAPTEEVEILEGQIKRLTHCCVASKPT